MTEHQFILCTGKDIFCRGTKSFHQVYSKLGLVLLQKKLLYRREFFCECEIRKCYLKQLEN